MARFADAATLQQAGSVLLVEAHLLERHHHIAGQGIERGLAGFVAEGLDDLIPARGNLPPETVQDSRPRRHWHLSPGGLGGPRALHSINRRDGGHDNSRVAKGFGFG